MSEFLKTNPSWFSKLRTQISLLLNSGSQNQLKTSATSSYSWLFVIPAVLALLCFAQSLEFGFVYDDKRVFLKAIPMLQDWSWENVSRAFHLDFWTFCTYKLPKEYKVGSSYYRPVFVLFSMAVSRLAGVSAWKWHLVTVILHALVASIAYQLLLKSIHCSGIPCTPKQSAWIALIATVFFVVHPAQIESVTWVSGIMNPLSGFCFLGSILAYLQARCFTTTIKSYLWLSISLIGYMLALLTKESGIVLLILILAYEFLIICNDDFGRKNLVTRLGYSIPFLLVTVGYVILRVVVLKMPITQINDHYSEYPEITSVSLWVVWFTLPKVLLVYLWMIVDPFATTLLHQVGYVFTPQARNFYLPLVTLFFITILGFWLAWKNRLVRLGLIWLVFPLLPMLNLPVLTYEIMVSDRYLYLSLLGAGLLLALGIERLNVWFARFDPTGDSPQAAPSWRLRGTIGLVVGTIFLVLILATIKQNRVWKNEWTLWTDAINHAPTSCLANRELGRLCSDEGNYQKAIAYYETAQNHCSNSVEVQYELAGLYLQVGDFNRSEVAFRRVLNMNPNVIMAATVFFNLGFLSEKRGEISVAIQNYEDGLKIDPNNSFAPQIRQVLAKLKRTPNPQ